MTYKELLGMLGMVDKLRFPQNLTGTWGHERRLGVNSTRGLGTTWNIV